MKTSHVDVLRSSDANGRSAIMSVSNVNIFEFHDENKANEWISWYNNQGLIGFSTADILLFVRTGPSSGISVSVFPSDEARKAGSEVRNEFHKTTISVCKRHIFFRGLR